MNKFSKGQSSKDQIIKLISAAFTLGKSNTNEDAYFISDRGFGVADGVMDGSFVGSLPGSLDGF